MDQCNALSSALFNRLHSKWLDALKSVEINFKACACSECLSGILSEYAVEQTDHEVKGWGARATQKSSDPQNRLWQLGAHFTNCSKLSNYSLVTRYFVFTGTLLQNKYGAFASWLASFPLEKKESAILWNLEWKQKKGKHLLGKVDKFVPKQMFWLPG